MIKCVKCGETEIEDGSNYCPICGVSLISSASTQSTDTRETKEPSAVAPLIEALRKIKVLVCGEKIPNWTSDWQTTNTRMTIADIADAALAGQDTPAPPKDLK